MKTQYFRCWVLLLAAAFLVLWCASVGVTYSASDTVLQEQAAAEAAAGRAWYPDDWYFGLVPGRAWLFGGGPHRGFKRKTPP